MHDSEGGGGGGADLHILYVSFPKQSLDMLRRQIYVFGINVWPLFGDKAHFICNTRFRNMTKWTGEVVLAYKR